MWIGETNCSATGGYRGDEPGWCLVNATTADLEAFTNERPAGFELEPIQREKTLSELVYNQLRQALMRGALMPGEKVTVRSIASALEVSITPAREALSRLVSGGALEAVGPKTIIVPHLTQEVLEEIKTIRVAVEGLAAEVGASKIDDQQIDHLSATQKALIDAMNAHDYRTVLKENESFHFEVYRASGMPRLVQFIESLWLRIGPSLNLLYPAFDRERHGIDNHVEILSALRRRDAITVRKAFQQDIEDGYAELVRALSATNSSASIAR